MSEIIPSGRSIVGIGDFNGDGHSDILLRSADGTITDWLADPNAEFYGNPDFVTNPGTSWHVEGTGDFDGDGKADILWRDDSGLSTDWIAESNGAFYGNAASFLAQVENGWQIIGTGDFNGDGRADILWQGAGQVTTWIADQNGGFYGNSANFLASLGIGWRVAGIGDFNGDGRDDILLRNDDGTVTDWLGASNGGLYGNAANFLIQVDNNVQVAGTGDFNGDGNTDILWRDNSGTITDWLGQSNGGFFDNSAVASQAVGTDLEIAGLGDFNGDGIADILWRGNNGSLDVESTGSDGTFIPTQEQVWHGALAVVNQFFDELTNQIGDYSPSIGNDPHSYYDDGSDHAPFDPAFLEMWGWVPSVQQNPAAHYWDFLTNDVDPEFQLAGLDGLGFTANFDGHSGSMTQVGDPASNMYLFDADGLLMWATWHPKPVPNPITPPPGAEVVNHPPIAGYWTFSLVGFGDMNYAQSVGGNFIEATQNWGAPVGVFDPLTHEPIYNPDGAILRWPSGINMAKIFDAGVAMGATEATVWLPVLFSHNGYYDFQRSGGSFHPEFIDASTVAIGIFCAAAGIPIETALKIENGFAGQFSNFGNVQMDPVYTHLPERNFLNTVIGYNIAAHIRAANGT